jgi:hypothetical protein
MILIAYTDENLENRLLVLRDLFKRIREADIKLRPRKAQIGFRPTRNSVDRIPYVDVLIG